MDTTSKVDGGAFTIPALCRYIGISTPTYYKMRAEGRGPREMRMSGSVVRISADAARDWIRKMETEPATVQKTRLKQRSLAANAGGR